MPQYLEMMMVRDMGGFTDWGPLVTMMALLAVGVVYFLAPTAGYTTYNRGLLLGSMWVLIAKLALVIFRTGIMFLQVMDMGSHVGSMGPSSSDPSKDMWMTTTLFSMLENGMFILALALFAGGLASLRRDRDRDRDRDLPMAQPPRFPNE